AGPPRLRRHRAAAGQPDPGRGRPAVDLHERVARAPRPRDVRVAGAGAPAAPVLLTGRVQRSTANSCQVPGTPLSWWGPWSLNAMPDPTTRSFTVPETSTSPAPASAPTRAAMWTASPPRVS